jgi:hypothetical protein
MSDFTDAFSELMDAYQDASGAAPVIEFGSDTVSVIPAEVPTDFEYVSGGKADGGQVYVMALVSAFTTLPADLDTVILSEHPSATDGVYQVLSRDIREGTVTFKLGNADAL